VYHTKQVNVVCKKFDFGTSNSVVYVINSIRGTVMGQKQNLVSEMT